ncbi:microsomal signal peptidase 25 kDa subunit [Lipomyces oligophaga]|uniref:microsomal signal peptidase 25 kDa subunit n=1 Tax=Lipomyces oligophaga TaxID=45792 RepID=UPI0034CFFFC8
MVTAVKKVNLSSTADMKTALDEDIIKYLTEAGYQQNFSLIDVRLGLGFTAVAVAGAVGYYDSKFGFEAAKQVTTIGVIIYFVLNSLLTLWVWLVEKRIIFVGKKAEETISLSTQLRKYQTSYLVEIKRKTFSADGKIEITQVFDSDGKISGKALHEFIDGLLDDKKNQ